MNTVFFIPVICFAASMLIFCFINIATKSIDKADAKILFVLSVSTFIATGFAVLCFWFLLNIHYYTYFEREYDINTMITEYNITDKSQKETVVEDFVGSRYLCHTTAPFGIDNWTIITFTEDKNHEFKTNDKFRLD